MQTQLGNIINILSEKYELPINNAQTELFCKYYSLLIEYQEKNRINLTRIIDPSDFALKNVIDTIILEKSLGEDVSKLIDLGTGNGIPGLFLAILNRDLNITLVDSTKKKIDFVNYIINCLELKNCVTVCDRIENLHKQKQYYEVFDAAIGRALAALDHFIKLSVPLVKLGGSIISQKSHKYEEELKSAEKTIKLCKLKLVDISKYEIENNFRIVLKYKKMFENKNDIIYSKCNEKSKKIQ
ncbi:16S rRNA (guanine(527)-N(7))-methyltransferase RsmG [Candidatus Dependentiae bacterium]|nr:16S rRNA (guanine(527)-N(7))-methyltransferase RsmG [Candidatus Dependentiae bacterium]